MSQQSIAEYIAADWIDQKTDVSAIENFAKEVWRGILKNTRKSGEKTSETGNEAMMSLLRNQPLHTIMPDMNEKSERLLYSYRPFSSAAHSYTYGKTLLVWCKYTFKNGKSCNLHEHTMKNPVRIRIVRRLTLNSVYITGRKTVTMLFIIGVVTAPRQIAVRISMRDFVHIVSN